MSTQAILGPTSPVGTSTDALLHPEREPSWCPGCGNFGVLLAVRRAIVQLGLRPHEVVVVSGIGCGSKLPDYLPTYGMLSLHGRPLSVATGIKLANPSLHVIVVNGDGDAYSIGAGALVHTARRNLDITHVVQNNQVFGLTGGQHSATSDIGFHSGMSPHGTITDALVPTTLTLAAGAGFVARSLANDAHQLGALIAQGIRFPGYAHIDVLQPCVSFGAYQGPEQYEAYRARSYQVGPDYDPSDRAAAGEVVAQWGDRIPLGVLYRAAEPRPTYGQLLAARGGALPVPGTAAHDPRRPEYRTLAERLA